MFWILLFIVLVALWAIVAFNGLVVLKNRVNEANSDISVQLKRRHDLIPNLVNIVKGYATHERELFERVTQARANAISAGGADMKERAGAENMLTGALKSLFAVVENYPELKANQNFLALQTELADTENKIMSSRRFYNTNVRDYNIRREMIPTNIIANMFSFKKRDLFELEDMKEAVTPDVNFDKKSSAPPTSPTPPTPPTPKAPSTPKAPEKPEPPVAPPAPTASPDISVADKTDKQPGGQATPETPPTKPTEPTKPTPDKPEPPTTPPNHPQQ